MFPPSTPRLRGKGDRRRRNSVRSRACRRRRERTPSDPECTRPRRRPGCRTESSPCRSPRRLRSSTRPSWRPRMRLRMPSCRSDTCNGRWCTTGTRRKSHCKRRSRGRPSRGRRSRRCMSSAQDCTRTNRTRRCTEASAPRTRARRRHSSSGRKEEARTPLRTRPRPGAGRPEPRRRRRRRRCWWRPENRATSSRHRRRRSPPPRG